MLAAAESPHISLVAEPIFHIGPVPVRNSMLLGGVALLVLFGLLMYTVKRIRERRYNRLSVAVLWVFETLLRTVEEVMGSREQARRIAPLAITMFFFIVINNWLGVMPFSCSCSA